MIHAAILILALEASPSKAPEAATRPAPTHATTAPAFANLVGPPPARQTPNPALGLHPRLTPGTWVLVPTLLGRRDRIADEAPADADEDSMMFTPIGPGDEPLMIEAIPVRENEAWLRAPFGDNLLLDPAQWRSERGPNGRSDWTLDYNRVDQLKFSGSVELQDPFTMLPRVGGRLEYATGRKRTLYGIQIEQPLLPPGRLAIGASMVRRTDHSELQQVGDLENSLALLFGRQDYRDYFEREGAGAYLSWRVPDFSTVSVHARTDDYRSLGVNRATRSWFQRDRALRDNPNIEDGTQRRAILRFERLALTGTRARAGFYHWVEFEQAGHGMGGDFGFQRGLADLRTVLRLTPASTLSIRTVAGHTAEGRLPVQRQFTVGGVDGLRAHSFSQFRGDQMVLAQTELDIGLWRLSQHDDFGGLHLLAFTDAGNAWSNPAHSWDVDRQRIEVDGGIGLATSDDALRVYFAKNLQKLASDFVVSMRLQRPF